MITNVRYASAFYLAALFLLNPVAWHFGSQVSGAYPDSIAYLVLADTLFREGNLFVAHWSHIDTGIVLPPLYSVFIGLGSYFLADGLKSAQLVSQVLILLSIVPLFFFLANYTTRGIAFITVLAIQLNYFYSLYGFAALTEATFLFICSTGLWLLARAVREGGKGWLFGLGVWGCLVFMTRQIGVVYLLLSFLLFLPAVLKKTVNTGKTGSGLVIILAGFLVIQIPYALALYAQSGQHPFTQWFRQMQYAVPENTVPAQNVVLKGLESRSESYQTWVKRRTERQLVPDASEMYAYLVPAQGKGILNSVLSNAGDPGRVLDNTINTSAFLKEATGLPVLLLFALVPLTLCCVKNNSVSMRERLILPGFVLLYWLSVTLLSGSVGRYLHILFPFVFLSVAMEAYLFSGYLHERGVGGVKPWLLAVMLGALLLLSLPKYYTSLNFMTGADEYAPLFKECGKSIHSGDPVFSTHPNNVYRLGGTYRVLPNDSLERVAAYAESTGVYWLLFVDTESDRHELNHYFFSDWAGQIAALDKAFPELVSMACALPEKKIFLYRFRRALPHE